MPASGSGCLPRRRPSPARSSPRQAGWWAGSIRAAEAAATAAGQPAPVIQAIGVGFPSVILGGVTRTAANVDPEWIGFEAQAAFSKAFKRRTWLVNDADAAGVAEMRFGAGHRKRGVVIVLTLGTGVGSGIFVDGKLVPNTELGHMEVNGRDAEKRSSANARIRRGLSWKAWAEDLDDHLRAIDLLFSPSLIILGGGVSKKADRFLPFLKAPGPIVAAELHNEAGIVGRGDGRSRTRDGDGPRRDRRRRARRPRSCHRPARQGRPRVRRGRRLTDDFSGSVELGRLARGNLGGDRRSGGGRPDPARLRVGRPRRQWRPERRRRGPQMFMTVRIDLHVTWHDLDPPTTSGSTSTAGHAASAVRSTCRPARARANARRARRLDLPGDARARRLARLVPQPGPQGAASAGRSPGPKRCEQAEPTPTPESPCSRTYDRRSRPAPARAANCERGPPDMTDQPATIATPAAARMIIGGTPVDAADGQTFEVHQPGDRRGHRNGSAGRPRGRRIAPSRRRARRSTIRRAGRAGRPASAAGPWPSSRAWSRRTWRSWPGWNRATAASRSAAPAARSSGSALSSSTTPGAANKVFGQTIPVSKPGLDITLREPIGVVGLIVPWNFPLLMASWKLGPALAAGNTCILKPASYTPADGICAWASWPSRRASRPVS